MPTFLGIANNCQDASWNSKLTTAICLLNVNSLYSSLPPIEVLRRIRQQRPDVFDKLEGMWVFCSVNHSLTLILKCTLTVRERKSAADKHCLTFEPQGGVRRGTG